MTIFKFPLFTSRFVLQIQKRSELCRIISSEISFNSSLKVQVVVVATYFYFGLSLIGSQELDTDDAQMFFPIILVLKFIFFIGWLKVKQISGPITFLCQEKQICTSSILWTYT